MSEEGSPKTYKELIEAFKALFDEIGPETPAEVDDVLRDAGYNPDEVAMRIQTLVQRALGESPLNWRNRARQELDEAILHLDSFDSPPKRSRVEMIAEVKDLLTRLGGSQHNLVAAHFRNLDQASDDDLVSLLSDLEYLARQQAK